MLYFTKLSIIVYIAKILLLLVWIIKLILATILVRRESIDKLLIIGVRFR